MSLSRPDPALSRIVPGPPAHRPTRCPRRTGWIWPVTINFAGRGPRLGMLEAPGVTVRQPRR